MHRTQCRDGNGKRVWKAYETLFVDGEDFCEIGEAFEQNREAARRSCNVPTGGGSSPLLHIPTVIHPGIRSAS